MSCEIVALTWEKERSEILPHECESKGNALYFVVDTEWKGKAY